MKIVHIIAVGPFTEGMTYQENILPECQQAAGNEVTIIANCTYWRKSVINYTNPVIKKMDNGVKLIRLPFRKILNDAISEKLRYLKGFYKTIDRERPDFVFLHDISTGITGELRRYLKKNNNVTLVIDSHVSYLNSGSNWISLRVLHGLIYRYFASKVFDIAYRVFYVGSDCKRFLAEVYRCDEGKCEFLPLGGKILPISEYNEKRSSTRKRYGISESEIVFVHSGKLDEAKKTTTIIDAFMRRSNKANSSLYIIGDTDDKERKSRIETMAKEDPSIHLLGWKSGSELSDFLCAADVYLQPGSPSATLQIAACNRCGIIISDYDGYQDLFGKIGVMIHSDDELRKEIDLLSCSEEVLRSNRERVFKVAMKELDYTAQSNRILSVHRNND